MNANYFCFIFFPLMVSSFWIPQPIVKKNQLKDIKNYDPDFYNTYDLYDKFEYYSILGNKEKQSEYMEKIFIYLQILKKINEKKINEKKLKK